MTTHRADLENAKVFLIEGSNAAENHPMAMKWIRKAQEKGAKIIHVDPRYNRTSNIADVYAPARRGHRLPRRDHPVGDRERLVRRRVREAPHQRALPRAGRLRHRERAVQRIRPREAQI